MALLNSMEDVYVIYHPAHGPEGGCFPRALAMLKLLPRRYLSQWTEFADRLLSGLSEVDM
jgi:hypothetical protein